MKLFIVYLALIFILLVVQILKCSLSFVFQRKFGDSDEIY